LYFFLFSFCFLLLIFFPFPYFFFFLFLFFCPFFAFLYFLGAGGCHIFSCPKIHVKLSLVPPSQGRTCTNTANEMLEKSWAMPTTTVGQNSTCSRFPRGEIPSDQEIMGNTPVSTQIKRLSRSAQSSFCHLLMLTTSCRDDVWTMVGYFFTKLNLDDRAGKCSNKASISQLHILFFKLILFFNMHRSPILKRKGLKSPMSTWDLSVVRQPPT